MNKRKLKLYSIISLLCIPSGIIVGILCAFFTYGLTFVNNTRNKYPYIFMPFLFLAGLLIAYIFNKFEHKETPVKHRMKLVFDTANNKTKNIPLRIIPIMSISTLITNLFGGSCGREGVAVQIGASVSKNFNHLIKNNKTLYGNEKISSIFVIAGMASGFASMFQTPIAGILFALEVITIRKIQFYALIPSIIEAYTGYFTAKLLFIKRETYNIYKFDYYSIKNAFDALANNRQISDISALIIFLLKIVIASLIFSMCGLLFTKLLKNCKTLYKEKVKNKYIGIAISGIILSILFMSLHLGRYSGSGADLIDMCFKNGNIYSYDFTFKLILTIFTLSVGFQGGEVTPLFTIGATLGYVLGEYLGIDCRFLASLGYVSVFASSANTLFCPIMLGVEIFGMHNLPFYIISVLIAYCFNFDNSIYPQNKPTKKHIIFDMLHKMH